MEFVGRSDTVRVCGNNPLVLPFQLKQHVSFCEGGQRSTLTFLGEDLVNSKQALGTGDAL